MKRLKDWQIRAIKTFVQAFGGIMIPAVVGLLSDATILTNWTVAKATLIAALCSALAAGISAVWNIILERMSLEEVTDDADNA